jgi:hypothetical protein
MSCSELGSTSGLGKVTILCATIEIVYLVGEKIGERAQLAYCNGVPQQYYGFGTLFTGNSKVKPLLNAVVDRD